MYNFENLKVNNNICYSRYIASWVNACHFKRISPYFDEDFEDWLRSMHIQENDIRNICEMAVCGKFELERNAEEFIKDYVL